MPPNDPRLRWPKIEAGWPGRGGAIAGDGILTLYEHLPMAHDLAASEKDEPAIQVGDADPDPPSRATLSRELDAIGELYGVRRDESPRCYHCGDPCEASDAPRDLAGRLAWPARCRKCARGAP